MPNILTNTVAAVAALLIVTVSMGAVITVPATDTAIAVAPMVA